MEERTDPMTSSSNDTDQLRYGFSEYPDHMSILWETSDVKPFVHVAQIWDDAAFQRFLAARDAERDERVKAELWDSGWAHTMTERVRAEQREADAQIAESLYFGADREATTQQWGAKQAAIAIRRAATDA
jgi:hypothetical protein